MYKYSYSVIGVLLALSLTSCSSKSMPQTIQDIAYGTKYSGENIIYIREDEIFVPFVVADNDYNSNTLLVRKDVLPVPQRINDYSAYYENSEIDKYLNEDYIDIISLDPSSIVLSSINITAEDSLGCSGNDIKTIDRKVFLLSLAEIGGDDSVNAGVEGSVVAYFKSPENRVACNNMSVSSWWLRTPNTYYLSCVYGVGADGKIGSGNAYDENGIRPAFCVPSALNITLRCDIIERQTVYVLSQED